MSAGLCASKVINASPILHRDSMRNFRWRISFGELPECFTRFKVVKILQWSSKEGPLVNIVQWGSSADGLVTISMTAPLICSLFISPSKYLKTFEKTLLKSFKVPLWKQWTSRRRLSSVSSGSIRLHPSRQIMIFQFLFRCWRKCGGRAKHISRLLFSNTSWWKTWSPRKWSTPIVDCVRHQLAVIALSVALAV